MEIHVVPLFSDFKELKKYLKSFPHKEHAGRLSQLFFQKKIVAFVNLYVLSAADFYMSEE